MTSTGQSIAVDPGPYRIAAGPANPPAVRCREIEPADDAAVSALLASGFEGRSQADWEAALKRIRAFAPGKGASIGHMLDAGGTVVGVLLTIPSPDGLRRNVSSWYTAPDYRRYAALLVSMAIRDRSVTYTNVSSVRHTRPIIEAQGFRRYADGIVLALPLLSRGARGVAVGQEPPAGARIDSAEARMAAAHRSMGCIVLWCTTAGRAQPYVFVRRKIADRLAVAQVVYCPPDADWRRVARPLGRALIRHGLGVLAVDAGGPIPGLFGRFLPGRMPKYARGPNPPRPGDLTFTETALFGA